MDHSSEKPREASPTFLDYMAERWYSCREMWSDCERGTVFTALSTTTNRLESSWNHLKKVLGKKLRIDMCVEVIFAYQTAVLRREYRTINKYASRLLLTSQCDPFMRWSMAEISEFCVDACAGKWHAFVNNEYEVEPSDHHAHQYTVSKAGPYSSAYTVDTDHWTCSCDFSTTSHLPCRHQIHVARNVMDCRRFPVAAIKQRWKMSSAFDLLPRLRACTAEIQSLRTSLLLVDSVFSKLLDPSFVHLSDGSMKLPRRVVNVRVQRYEEADLIELSNLEKRSVLRTEFDRVTQFLMN